MKKVMPLLFMVTALSGCSSIVSKSEYTVAIASVPASANYTVTNKSGLEVHSGVTPDSVSLKASSGFFKGETYKIKFQKDGYPDREFALKSSVDGWYFGNILFGGLIGMLIVDPATGAMYNLPKRVDVTLDAADEQSGSDQITINTIDRLSEEEKARLVRII